MPALKFGAHLQIAPAPVVESTEGLVADQILKMTSRVRVFFTEETNPSEKQPRLDTMSQLSRRVKFLDPTDFAKIVEYLLQSHKISEIKVHNLAIEAMQMAAESFLWKLMRHANMCAQARVRNTGTRHDFHHTDRVATVQSRDIDLAWALQDGGLQANTTAEMFPHAEAVRPKQDAQSKRLNKMSKKLDQHKAVQAKQEKRVQDAVVQLCLAERKEDDHRANQWRKKLQRRRKRLAITKNDVGNQLAAVQEASQVLYSFQQAGRDALEAAVEIAGKRNKKASVAVALTKELSDFDKKKAEIAKLRHHPTRTNPQRKRAALSMAARRAKRDAERKKFCDKQIAEAAEAEAEAEAAAAAAAAGAGARTGGASSSSSSDSSSDSDPE